MIIDGDFKEVHELQFVPVYKGKLHKYPKRKRKALKINVLRSFLSFKA